VFPDVALKSSKTTLYVVGYEAGDAKRTVANQAVRDVQSHFSGMSLEYQHVPITAIATSDQASPASQTD
jgi:hypothetical protein